MNHDPYALTRLETLAAGLVPELKHLSIWGRADWLRAYLTSEIAKRRAGATNGTKRTTVVKICAKCELEYEVSYRRANESTLCRICRFPKLYAPDESQAWAQKIPDERLDELAGAPALLR